MTAISFLETDDSTVKARLIRAADAEIAEYGTEALQMEAVAKRAGVSRATAFRQLGSVSEVLVQVALLRSQRHTAELHRLMDSKAGVFAKIEAALVYTAHELPTDPAIAHLISQHSASVHDPRVHESAMGLLGEVLRDGQRDGAIRADLTPDELVDFLVEQTYLAAEEIDRSENAVRKRFRQFVIPALEARSCFGGEYASRVKEVEYALSIAREALENLGQKLCDAKPSIRLADEMSVHQTPLQSDGILPSGEACGPRR
jgi:AcrR family transcriptional regulator